MLKKVVLSRWGFKGCGGGGGMGVYKNGSNGQLGAVKKVICQNNPVVIILDDYLHNKGREVICNG